MSINKTQKHISIIGAGKVGKALYHAMIRAELSVSLIEKSEAEQREATGLSDIVLLTVQDSVIETVCKSIAPFTKAGSTIAHCSGALSAQPLELAKEHDCFTGTAHPLNTFPNEVTAQALLENTNHDTYCFISGDNEATTELTALFSSLGFKPSIIKDDAKIAYHAACVFLCNYLTSLSEIGLQTAELAGLDRQQFWQAVQPLMRSTLDNISMQGTQEALSGPIARADTSTITAHLNELSKAPDVIESAYKMLGQQAIELADAKGNLSAKQINELREALS